MADRLKQFARTVHKALDNDYDFVVLVDGKEGVGKSTYAGWLKALFEGEWNLDHITYDGLDLLEDMNTAPAKTCLWMDEMKDAAYKRKFYSDLNIALAQAFGIVRSKNYFFILNIPNYWDLDTDLRTRIDYRIYCEHKKRVRGFSSCYEIMRTPWTKGNPYMELRWTYRFPPAPQKWYDQYYKFKSANQTKKMREYQQAAKGEGPEKKRRTYVRDSIVEALDTDPAQDLNLLAGELGVSPGYVKQIAKTHTH